jgi:hypothetical protein
MKESFTLRIATIGLVILFSLIIVFHLLAILGVIPFDMLWGGRLESASQMIVFETVSIVINLMMLAVVALHAGYLKWKAPPLAIRIALWIMVVLFALNTIGNLNSLNEMEKLIFTPTTFLLSLLCLRLAVSKR